MPFRKIKYSFIFRQQGQHVTCERQRQDKVSSSSLWAEKLVTRPLATGKVFCTPGEVKTVHI